MKERIYLWAILATLVMPACIRATDWPQWRGPFFNGSTDETDLPDSWGETENVIWISPLPGPSGATPVICNGRVFVSSMVGKGPGFVALSFDARDGNKLWERPIGSDSRRFPRNNMTSPSPVADGKNVFFLFGSGDLVAFDYEGNELWTRNIQTEYGNLALKFGYSSSPFLYRNKLFILVIRRDKHYQRPEADGPLDSYLMALNPQTGKTLWKQPRPTNAFDEGMETYSTPIPFVRAGRTEILNTGADFITAHDPDTGRELWRFEYQTTKVRDSRVIPSLVAGDGLIFGARHKHNGVFVVKPGGPDNPSKIRIVWEFNSPVPDCSTPLFYRGRLYVLDGIKNGKVVTCLDPKTGRQFWQGKIGGRGPWRASLTGADGKLYCINETGEIIVLAAGDDEFKILFESKTDETPIQSSIAVANGRLFIRTAKNLHCIGKEGRPHRAAPTALRGQGGAGEIWPGASWERATPEQVGMDAGALQKARDFALTGAGSGCVTRHGKLVMQWGDQKKLYDLKSTTKAIGVTAVGLALKDGKFKSLRDPAKKYHPSFGVPPESNAETGWPDKVTLFHLATQTAGFDKNGGYTKLMFAPGTKWAYSDGGPNWLAECVTLAYGRDLHDLMFERVFGPIGIEKSDLTWRNNAYRPKEIGGIKRREFGSGISANVNAMARIGYLYLRRGRWRNKQIIPASFVDTTRMLPEAVGGLPVVKSESYFNASDHYGLLWWNNDDGTMANVPRDTYWSWGLYDSLIVVIPSLDIVAARAGKSLNKARNSSYKAIEPFIELIATAVNAASYEGRAPYPPSPVIKGIEWAPVETIVRRASGSDNWPTTWADDGNLYSAYGDGWGFEPKTRKKLSLGIVKIIGAPTDFQGFNVRTETGERIGQGANGAKASGMLMVDGVLYMLVRNTGNSQVAWSNDHGKSWTWCDWKFQAGFGAPAFLNFGKDYAGARDRFVYIYSHNAETAYDPADEMVMARVPKSEIRNRSAYEFFKGLDDSGRPVWTKNIRRRGSVFTNPGKCYRSQVSYNAGIKRYLWCQVLPTSKHPQGMRFQGGFGIYDAPEPWGPWTTVFYIEEWDVGPGETNSFPTRWISDDGRTCHLVFSGDDCFSVRKATLKVTE